jgi:hypothetical protein
LFIILTLLCVRSHDATVTGKVETILMTSNTSGKGKVVQIIFAENCEQGGQTDPRWKISF